MSGGILFKEQQMDLSTFEMGNAEANEIVEIDIEKEIADFPLVSYGSRLYVIEEQVIKSHGLYVPENARREGEMRTNIGIVVSVGDEVTFVKPGDRIFYGQYSGAWVMDMKYRVMNEKDILGRFK